MKLSWILLLSLTATYGCASASHAPGAPRGSWASDGLQSGASLGESGSCGSAPQDPFELAMDTPGAAERIGELMLDGAVLVAADGCGFEVLPTCFAEVKYESSRGARAAHARQSAAGETKWFESKQLSLPRPVRRAELVGACEEATHVVDIISLGALERRSSSGEVLFSSGSLSSCQAEPSGDSCSQITHIRLIPLDVTSDRPKRPAPPPPSGDPEQQNECVDDPLCGAEPGGAS